MSKDNKKHKTCVSRICETSGFLNSKNKGHLWPLLFLETVLEDNIEYYRFGVILKLFFFEKCIFCVKKYKESNLLSMLSLFFLFLEHK